MDIRIGLRNKATGALVVESYATLGTLGVPPMSERCYKGADALAATITVRINEARDSLSYSLNIVRPHNATAGYAAKAAGPASAAAEAPVDTSPLDGVPVSVPLTPAIREAMAKAQAQLDALSKQDAYPKP